MRIRRSEESDLPQILTIINDAAQAYRGVIPADCSHDPYMTAQHLRDEIAHGVSFLGCETDGALAGVMGLQRVGDVDLIRHAYVRPAAQGMGILLISSDLPEVLAMSDRILVMREGQQMDIFSREEATQEVVIGAAMGQKPSQKAEV